MSGIEPSRYPSNDAAEQQALAVLQMAVDHARVKLDVKGRDKYPNTDGTVEVVDAATRPLGKLEVQVRKIPGNATSYQCPVSLYEYSGRCSLPILLLAVDVDQQIVWWRHIYRGMPGYKEGQKTFVIHFRKGDEAGAGSRYISQWLGIAKDYASRVESFPKISRRLATELDLSDLCEADRTYFRVYAERLNEIIGSDFSSLKTCVLPPSARICVEVLQATDDSVTMNHCAAGPADSIPTVFSAGLKDGERLFDPQRISSVYVVRDHMKTADEQARQFVRELVVRMVDGRMLPIRGHLLAEDVVRLFAARYPNVLNTTGRGEIDLPKLCAAFSERIPRACMSIRHMLLDQLGAGEAANVTLELLEVDMPLLLDPATPSDDGPVHLTSNMLPFRLLDQALRVLGETDTLVAEVPRQKYRFAAAWPDIGGDAECIAEELRLYLGRCLREYELFVAGNGFRLHESRYLRVDRSMLVLLSPGNRGIASCPVMECVVRNESLRLPKVIVFLVQEGTHEMKFDCARSVWVLKVQGQSFDVDWWGCGTCQYMFGASPHFDAVYRMLARDLNSKYETRLAIP